MKGRSMNWSPELRGHGKMENKMVFWFVVRVIGITTLLIGLYVLYTGISPFFPAALAYPMG